MRSEPTIPESPADEIAEQSEALRRADLWRSCVALDSAPGPKIRIEGREYLHLCSNNYLDLAAHPAVIEAAREAAARWGAGAGAARLITGTSAEIAALERELAEFKRAEAALVFSSGYLANLGAVQALAEPGDWLFCDELNHASLIDAARLSRAETRVYPHRDMETLAGLLARAPETAKKIFLTDGVFSMDGTIAPLAELSALALEHGAWLVVDDAHGTGVAGPEGRGSCAAAGVEGEHVIQISTLSKSLGSQGGAVLGSRRAIDFIMNRARSFIFETALAPPAVAAARAALRLIESEPARLAALRRNIECLRAAFVSRGLPVAPDSTPIFPVMLGSNRRALDVAEALKSLGYWAAAIRPPTVAEGAARLRVTVMAAHGASELEAFADNLASILSKR